MKKLNNKRGFTMAELLVVVAIIAVLVAITIPNFKAQSDKAAAAVDLANFRSTYAQVISEGISGNTSASAKVTTKGESTKLGETLSLPSNLEGLSSWTKGKEYTLTYSDNKVTVTGPTG